MRGGKDGEVGGVGTSVGEKESEIREGGHVFDV